MTETLCLCGCGGRPSRRGKWLRGHHPNPPKDRHQAFWEKVDKDGPVPSHQPDLGPCWLWIGTRNQHGYGTFSVTGHAGSRITSAHRWAYAEEHGPIPAGVLILHECDNPPCVRPSHLHPGDYVMNANEAVERGLIATGKAHHNAIDPTPLSRGVDRYNARFTEDQVREIRRLHDEEGLGGAEIARRLDLGSHWALYQIIRRETWKHVA